MSLTKSVNELMIQLDKMSNGENRKRFIFNQLYKREKKIRKSAVNVKRCKKVLIKTRTTLQNLAIKAVENESLILPDPSAIMEDNENFGSIIARTMEEFDNIEGVFELKNLNFQKKIRECNTLENQNKKLNATLDHTVTQNVIVNADLAVKEFDIQNLQNENRHLKETIRKLMNQNDFKNRK